MFMGECTNQPICFISASHTHTHTHVNCAGETRATIAARVVCTRRTPATCIYVCKHYIRTHTSSFLCSCTAPHALVVATTATGMVNELPEHCFTLPMATGRPLILYPAHTYYHTFLYHNNLSGTLEVGEKEKITLMHFRRYTGSCDTKAAHFSQCQMTTTGKLTKHGKGRRREKPIRFPVSQFLSFAGPELGPKYLYDMQNLDSFLRSL